MRYAMPNCLSFGRFLTAVTLVSLVCCLCSRAEQKQHPRKENRRADSHTVEQLEEQWRQSLLQSDVPALDKLLSEDFTGISANGTVSDKHQYLARISKHETAFKQIDVLESRLKARPGLVIATSEARVQGSLEERPIRGIFRYTKVYTRDTDGHWRLVSFEATRVSGPRSDGMDMQQGQPLNSMSPNDRTPADLRH